MRSQIPTKNLREDFLQDEFATNSYGKKLLRMCCCFCGNRQTALLGLFQPCEFAAKFRIVEILFQMDYFEEIIKQSLTNFAKSFTVNVWVCSGYASALLWVMFFAGSKYLLLVRSQQWKIQQFICVFLANFENIHLVNPK